jgi:cleavage and polyadenylation specificity factor subunit 3
MEPDEVVSLKGNTLPRKMSVDEVSFSAHVDYQQNAEFIDLVKAPHIVRRDFLFPENVERPDDVP